MGTGTRTSLRSLAWLAGVLVPLALTGCGEPLVEHVSTEGRFRISLPGEPTVLSGEDLPPGVRKVTLEQRSGSYSVAREDLPNRDDRSTDDLLDMACNGALERLKARPISRKPISLAGKYPGRELYAEWPGGKGVILDRLYVAEGRLYHVIASGQRWWVESPTTRQVLDSFAIVDDE